MVQLETMNTNNNNNNNLNQVNMNSLNNNNNNLMMTMNMESSTTSPSLLLPSSSSSILNNNNNSMSTIETMSTTLKSSLPPNIIIQQQQQQQDTITTTTTTMTNSLLLPNKILLNVYMPNQQRTIVEINHNRNQNNNGGLQHPQTIRDVLMRAMKKRRLTTDVCYVCYIDNGKPIDWDVEVSRLVSRNIEVRIISHEIRREFFPLANCDLCRKLLFHGLRCQACGIRYHLRCEQLISPICRAGQHSIQQNKIGRHHYRKNQSRGINDLNGNNIGTIQNNGSSSNSGKQDIKRTNSEPDRINTIINTDQTTTTTTKLEQNNNQIIINHNNNVNNSNHNHNHNNNRPRSADEKLHIDSNRESIRDWEIPQSEIIVRECIGSGSYGTVFRGHWHGSVALKKLKVAEPTQAQLLEFKNEIAVLRKTRHVNIILFMGYVSKPHLTIVTQWCEGSSLYKHLHVMDTKFEMIQMFNIARQTAQGMDYLHAKKIIHRDLKSNNIFLHKDYTVKIGDFGLATVKTQWDGSQRLNQPTGSILWMAPEVIRMASNNPYTFQSDVYGYGIVLYEIATSRLPYQHINNPHQILYMVGRGHLRPDFSKTRDGLPKKFIKLIENCIDYDMQRRPLFNKILERLDNIQVPRILRSISTPNLNEDFVFGKSSAADFVDFDLHEYRSMLPQTTITTATTTTANNNNNGNNNIDDYMDCIDDTDDDDDDDDGDDTDETSSSVSSPTQPLSPQQFTTTTSRLNNNNHHHDPFNNNNTDDDNNNNNQPTTYYMLTQI
ncbi:hypothetical protein DERP_006023 [Dermatophagoides pteronyssinus]|uniref:Serine/threonine-protein kinase A-Raf-like n=1 Tax=Dermatophagoides pteronyssinus TaxID=6956 RepID=A0ABQ8JSK9_DERPT|nr:hypothetical protein DERP_006023 [Dermatophagoides pteronyssinus]